MDIDTGLPRSGKIIRLNREEGIGEVLEDDCERPLKLARATGPLSKYCLNDKVTLKCVAGNIFPAELLESLDIHKKPYASNSASRNPMYDIIFDNRDRSYERHEIYILW
jgi:hypothetical protein